MRDEASKANEIRDRLRKVVFAPRDEPVLGTHLPTAINWSVIATLPVDTADAFFDWLGLDFRSRLEFRLRYMEQKTLSGIPVLGLKDKVRRVALRHLQSTGAIITTRLAVNDFAPAASTYLFEKSEQLKSDLVDHLSGSAELLNIALRLGLAGKPRFNLRVKEIRSFVEFLDLYDALPQLLDHALYFHPTADSLVKSGVAYINAVREEPDYVKLQKSLDSYILNKPLPLSAQTTDQLACSTKVCSWLDGVLPNSPSEREARWWRDFRAILNEYYLLAGHRFAGRTSEVKAVRDYIGLDANNAPFPSLVKAISNLRQRGPLVISGPAGMGKTSIVARVIYEESLVNDKSRLIISVLDFERPSLIVREPATVLMEIIRQVSPQLPNGEVFDDLLAELTAELEEVSVKGQQSMYAGNVQHLALSLDRLNDYTVRFAERIREQTSQATPLVLVLDSYELVVINSRAFEESLWLFLDNLAKQLPSVKPIVVGRVDYISKAKKRLSIAKLGQSSVLTYYQRRGIDDATALSAFQKFGGVPLLMRVFADLMEGGDQGQYALRDALDTDNVIDDNVTVALYQRLLSRIENSAVRKLAWPGFVLRWLDAGTVLKVLNAPCGLGISSRKEAQDLLNELSREATLVNVDGDRLRPRTDVRRLMVEHLSTELREAREIRLAAVEYFRGFDSASSRAEELYHRLAIGDDLEAVDDRWTDEAGNYLAEMSFELSNRAKAYLAGRLRLDIPDIDWQSARDVDWERYAFRSANDYLEIGNARKAIRVLQVRRARSDRSLLYLLESEAHLRAGQEPSAREVCKRGYESLSRMDSIAWRQVALLYCFLLERSKREKEARRVLGEVAAIHEWSRPWGMQLVQMLLELRRERMILAEKGSDDDLRKLAKKAVGLLHKTGHVSKIRFGLLRRDIAAEIAQVEPRFMATFIRQHGLGPLTGDRISVLTGIFQAYDEKHNDVQTSDYRAILTEGTDHLADFLEQLEGDDIWRRIGATIMNSVGSDEILSALRDAAVPVRSLSDDT